MKFLTPLVILLAALCLVQCGGPSAIEIRSGSGPALQPNQTAYVSFRYYKTPTQVLIDSKNAKTPPAIMVSPEAPPTTMAYYLNDRQVGDSITFEIMARDFFMEPSGVLKLPEGVISADMITFQLRVDSVVSQAEYDSREAERQARIADAPRIRLQNKLYETRTYYQQVLDMEGVRERIAEEGKAIDAEIAKRGELAFKSENGVRMVIVEEELGDLITPGDYVFVNYTGYLLDGTFFDTNIKEVARQYDALNPQRSYRTLRFQLGVGNVIMGWEEAFKTLSVGTKAVLYVPSPMGYGAQGSGEVIPPHTPLRFEIEITQAEKPF